MHNLQITSDSIIAIRYSRRSLTSDTQYGPFIRQFQRHMRGDGASQTQVATLLATPALPANFCSVRLQSSNWLIAHAPVLPSLGQWLATATRLRGNARCRQTAECRARCKPSTTSYGAARQFQHLQNRGHVTFRRRKDRFTPGSPADASFKTSNDFLSWSIAAYQRIDFPPYK